MDDETLAFTTATTLLHKSRSLPVLDPLSTDPETLKVFPTDAVIARGNLAKDAIATESKDMLNAAMTLVTHKPLVANALPNGGTMDVSLAPAEGGLELSVIDSGTGIAPDIHPRLFEPFATGKETGLGLGLVVSKRIVEDHGGTITGANRPAGGAMFTVRLP